MNKIKLKYLCYNPGNYQAYYKCHGKVYCFQDRGGEGMAFLRCSKDGEPSYELDVDRIDRIDQLPPQHFCKELKKADIKLLKLLNKSARIKRRTKAADKINRLVLSTVAAINSRYIVRERNGKTKLIRKHDISAPHQMTLI